MNCSVPKQSVRYYCPKAFMKVVAWLFILLLTNWMLGHFVSALPWWYIAITGIGFGYVSTLKPIQAWIVGFVTVGILWAAQAYFLDAAGGKILAPKMANLFAPITAGSTTNLFLLVGAIGGLVSGFAMLSGTLMRTAFSK